MFFATRWIFFVGKCVYLPYVYYKMAKFKTSYIHIYTYVHVYPFFFLTRYVCWPCNNAWMSAAGGNVDLASTSQAQLQAAGWSLNMDYPTGTNSYLRNRGCNPNWFGYSNGAKTGAFRLAHVLHAQVDIPSPFRPFTHTFHHKFNTPSQRESGALSDFRERACVCMRVRERACVCMRARESARVCVHARADKPN